MITMYCLAKLSFFQDRSPWFSFTWQAPGVGRAVSELLSLGGLGAKENLACMGPFGFMNVQGTISARLQMHPRLKLLCC